MPQSTIQLTLDKRTAERIRLAKKISGGKVDVNAELNKALLAPLTSIENRLKITQESWKNARPCPKCAKGTLLLIKRNKPPYSEFFGCSQFPQCRHSESK